MDSKKDSSDKELSRSLRDLQQTIEHIPRRHDFFFHPGKHLFFTFLKGIVSGLGVIAAAVIVIPILLWMLQGVAWVPLIGDFVSDIAERMEEARSR